MSSNASNFSDLTGAVPTDIHDLALGLCFVSSCLSILGGVAILLTYAYMPNTRNFTRYLLVCLTLADLLTAVGYLTGALRYMVLDKLNISESTSKVEAVCVGQSFAIIFSNLASYFWTIVIAVHIYVSVVYQTNRTGSLNWKIFYHLVCWATAATVAVMALGFNVLGEDTTVRPLPWCFLRGNIGHTKLLTWTFVTAIFWELLTYLVTVNLYIYLKIHLYRRHRYATSIHDVNPVLRSEDQTYTYVWFVLYLLKVWGTVRVFIVVVHPHATQDDYWSHLLNILLYIQSFTTSGQAFWNCVFFCMFDRTVRANIGALSWLKRAEEHATDLQTTVSFDEDERTPLVSRSRSSSRRYND